MLGPLKAFLKKHLSKSPFRYALPEDASLIADIRNRRLTYLSESKMLSIASTCRSIESRRLQGLFIEAGCALGGSTILLRKTMGAQYHLNVYDVFGMIPAPSDNDPQDVHERYATIAAGESSGIDGDSYYGYERDLYSVVLANLRSFGIEPDRERLVLIKGLLQETMTLQGPVAFAHIDVDWYDPVFFSLSQIAPRLVIGGSIILDDYHDWGGCRKATDDFLASCSETFVRDDSAGSLKLTRVT